MKKKPLFEDDETYVNDSGLFVFTEAYLLKRGYCCGNGCLHCPYEYKNVINLERKQQLINQQRESKIQLNSSSKP